MEARAHLRYARIAPRKVSVVLDLIRGEDLDKALAILQYTPKAASELLYKLVKSAAANAENNHNMDKNNLYVAECFVTPGPTLKRVMPRAQGRAFRILKRTSQITVVLKENEYGGKTVGVRKSIPTDFAWASSKIGTAAGLRPSANSATPWLKITRSARC